MIWGLNMKRIGPINSNIGAGRISRIALVSLSLLSIPCLAVDTPYMAACRAQGVPIPPDWAESGTPWIYQGNLRTGTNLLQPGADAFVWTYSDPDRRGACIALPRGTGSPGSLAGFICQSATTGTACFWDNMPKNDQRPGILGWKGVTLKISELADGSNLTGVTGNCPVCHRGDNVFLISPDDPVWTKVLRGPLVTDSNSTFTTNVESSSDNQGGHPRYVPLSGLSGPRPGWTNPYKAGDCAGSCHENPVLEFSNRPSMPPVCAVDSVENCYTLNSAWLPPVMDLLID